MRFFLFVFIFFAFTPIIGIASTDHGKQSFPTVVRSTLPLKVVALTFDDGPYGTSTQEVLDILQAKHVKGSFFLIGKNIEKYPYLAKEEVADGEMIGNHTYDHPKNLPYLSPLEIDTELSQTDTVLASSTGIYTKLFRPPYGNLTQKLLKEIRTKGYKTIMWNVDPKDWDYASSTSNVIITHILTHLKKRMIIVFHDGRDIQIDYPRDNLINALPTVIDDLKQRGYSFVTVDQLETQ